MCIVKTPDVSAQEVPERQAARAPDGGDATVRASDRSRRRLAMAASIFTPQNGTLGTPVVSGTATTSMLGA